MILKVCGITTLEDALASIRFGADALGLNFYEGSPRFLRPEAAERILDGLPEKVLKVAVVVGTDWAFPLERFDAVQIHGLRFEADVPQGPPLRKIVAVSPRRADRFPRHEILVDTSWGRGKLGDWEAISRLRRPFLLSGGLDPDNVEEAVLRLRPAGVDVCSGVESSPGRKDPRRLRLFLEAACRARDLVGASAEAATKRKS